MLITNMDKDFQNIVTKLVQMAHKVTQISKSLNGMDLSTEPSSNMLITNMDINFENIVNKWVQMAHKVAKISKH